jgi:hypothetical protein
MFYFFGTKFNFDRQVVFANPNATLNQLIYSNSIYSGLCITYREPIIILLIFVFFSLPKLPLFYSLLSPAFSLWLSSFPRASLRLLLFVSPMVVAWAGRWLLLLRPRPGPKTNR